MSVDRIVAHLGRYQLQSLTPLQIERFYTDQLESGGRERGPLSPKTVRNTHVVLRKALADAERLELVPRNAAAAARPPAPERRDMTTWSSDDLGTFLAGPGEIAASAGMDVTGGQATSTAAVSKPRCSYFPYDMATSASPGSTTGPARRDATTKQLTPRRTRRAEHRDAVHPDLPRPSARLRLGRRRRRCRRADLIRVPVGVRPTPGTDPGHEPPPRRRRDRQHRPLARRQRPPGASRSPPPSDPSGPPSPPPTAAPPGPSATATAPTATGSAPPSSTRTPQTKANAATPTAGHRHRSSPTPTTSPTTTLRSGTGSSPTPPPPHAAEPSARSTAPPSSPTKSERSRPSEFPPTLRQQPSTPPRTVHDAPLPSQQIPTSGPFRAGPGGRRRPILGHARQLGRLGPPRAAVGIRVRRPAVAAVVARSVRWLRGSPATQPERSPDHQRRSDDTGKAVNGKHAGKRGPTPIVLVGRGIAVVDDHQLGDRPNNEERANHVGDDDRRDLHRAATLRRLR